MVYGTRTISRDKEQCIITMGDKYIGNWDHDKEVVKESISLPMERFMKARGRTT